MTPPDDGDFSKTARQAPSARARRARWVFAAAVLLVLAGVIGGWAMRKTLARKVLADWCSGRELVCSTRFDELGLTGAVMDDLSVTGQGQAAFEASKVRVRLDWPGLFRPRVTAIELDAPALHGTLSDGQLGFHGLERLVPSGGSGGGGALPAVDIREGRILIGTSAGEVSARVSASGVFPDDAKASITLDPASLDEPQGYLRWSGGVADLIAKDGQLEGQVNLTLEEMRTDDVTLSDTELVASLESGIDETAPARLVWEGRVAEASGADFALTALQASGHARLDRITGASVEELFAALTEADVQLDAGQTRWRNYAADTGHIEASLRKTDDVIAGPSEIALTDVTIPQGRAGALTAAGDLSWAKESGGRFVGQISTTNAALSETASDTLLNRVKLPAPLTAHGASLRAALGRALSDFGAASRVNVTAHNGAVALEAQDDASLSAASGLALSVSAPRPERTWFSLKGGQTFVGGNVTLKGGGAPRLSADLESLTFGSGGLRVDARSVDVSPWRANGTRFGMSLSSLTVHSTPDDLSVNADGSVSLSGPVFGIELAESRLSGAIQVINGEDGLRVEPVNQPCLLFDTQGVKLGGVAFQPNRLNLCPRQGAFMKPGNGDASGTASLGDVSWPFESKSVTGVLNLEKAAIDWSVRKGFSLALSSPELGLPMNIGDRTLSIDAARPRVRLATAKGKVPALSAMLGPTVFGGSLIPAKVSADEIRFDGAIGAAGLSGDLAGDAVLIRDFRDDPVYQPLLSDLTAQMHEWQLALHGPLRLQASDVPVGEITADINVLTLDGTARVATRVLEFRKGGLQPVMLSERLRGVYTDAAGSMEAVSDVVIDGGRLAGTADVSVSDFGFQTTRLGRVENVDGQVHFADLFTLSTDPTQVLTVGGMNPGIPLLDGRIVFALSGGKVLVVESAAFPFAGGTLALAPFDWTLGADTQHVEVTADAIELAELVRILKLPKIEAEGTVSGRFPIDVERSNVLIRDARLFADDSGGRVAYLGDAADSAARSDANVRLAFEALKDFDFTVLEVGLDGNVADRVKITLKLAGKSRNDITYGANAHIVRGQPFEFNIAVDSALAELFRSSQFYTNQQKLTDFVVEEVLTDRGLKIQEDE
ncbi:intermembrane phospholipid transport protein YdbH family protein [Hyphomonas adhaerens]|uniref:intermembrane phospholipid transport protein YdbH family protein n=1 Tax=Hyphomonas adhaerens TaxID=81029 RepID=UPI0012EB1F05|nr:YdbH domain-containing protein [Hyphomonas adhaerens]